MAGKKSSRSAPAGRGEVQPNGKAKAKTAFPRPKVAELLEARGHLTYFQELLVAQEAAIKRLDVNRQICAKNIQVWNNANRETSGDDVNGSDKIQYGQRKQRSPQG